MKYTVLALALFLSLGIITAAAISEPVTQHAIVQHVFAFKNKAKANASGFGSTAA